MARKQPFTVIFAPQVMDHFDTIEPRHHSAIRAKIEEQLLFDPTTETRNRKRLREPGLLRADWELRCGTKNQFRVLYRVDADRATVNVLGLGVKEGERLFVGGEELET
jgi:mRNA-degrading endonuclease RelE of RelBE toxin-antitoxin system